MIELTSQDAARAWFARRNTESRGDAAVRKDALAAALSAAKPQLVEVFSGETGYSQYDAGALIDAALQYVRQYDPTHPDGPDAGAIAALPPMSFVHAPWGRTVIALPANAVLPLAVILGLAFAQAGNRVVLSAPRNGHETMKLVAMCFASAGYDLAWWSSGSRSLIDTSIAERSIECLYFIGGSAHYADISGRCAEAGIELIFEGEGRSTMIVDDTLSREQVRASAVCLFDSKRLWGGRMCSAPNSVLVARAVANAFVDEFARLASVTTDAPVALPPQCVDFLAARLVEGARLIPVGTDLSAPSAPVLVWHDDLIQDSAAVELFGQATLGSIYDDDQALLQELGRSRYGLQLSVFSNDGKWVSRLMRDGRVARVCVNMLPVSQDPTFAWGAYGLSGRSPVCTFAEKAYRKILVESWGLPAEFAAEGGVAC